MIGTAVSADDKRKAPRRMNAQERRRQIVRTAMGLFARKGFKGTTTKEIALAAGVNEAIIFRHFPTKQDLYSAIIDLKVEKSREWIAKAHKEAGRRKDDQAVFLELARGILTFHHRDATFMRLLLYSALEGHELSRMFFATQITNHAGFLIDYIAQRIDDGAFQPVDPKVAARAFLGMIVNYAQVRELFDRKGELLNLDSEAAAEQFVKIFLEGMERQ
jgi:AcrR family transcriptional regulator